MREIKFRAWIKTACFGSGMMLYPNNKDTDYGMVCNGDGFGIHDPEDNWLNQNDFELMQFTGLYDKNGVGKEIYERDICSFNYNGEKRIEEVHFMNGAFCLGWCMTLNEAFQNCHKEVRNSLEVIGNSIDNPSLLEVQP